MSKELERLEDEYNRRENMEEPMEKCGEQCEYCKDTEKSLRLEISSLKAQIERDSKDYQYFIQRLRDTLGTYFFSGSADEEVNIVASINEMKKSIGSDVQAQRRNFEEQRNKVSRLESEIRLLKADKENLKYSIEVKDRKHRDDLEEANNRAVAGYEEVADMEGIIQDCHNLLDKYNIEEPDYEDKTLPDRITFLLKRLDPEYAEYLRLKEKFEPDQG